MYRRSPAESGYLLYYPQFRNICQAGILIYDRVNLLSVGESQKIPCYRLAQIVFS